MGDAPDDQVLNKLLGQGSWIHRASFGWLPVSYLRSMPAFYHGVDPVIDHDHGSLPGLKGHSTTEPMLPPVKVTPPKAHASQMKCQPASPSTTVEWCEATCNPEF